MKFIAGLRVWVNGPLGKTPQVFPRFSGSANRRVDLHLPLIASIEISRKSLALKELTSDIFGLLYAEQTQFPGRGGRDARELAMPEAGTQTGLAHAGSANFPGSPLPMRWSLLECQD